MPFTDVRDVCLFFTDEGEGEPVLFVHGFSCDSHDWSWQLPYFMAAGYRVIAVGSGADALAALQSDTRFDLIVTDIEMPEMDGFALAEAVRGTSRTAALPIIALSAMVSADAIERGRAVGFHDFVAKFDRTGLIAAIKEQSADLDVAA